MASHERLIKHIKNVVHYHDRICPVCYNSLMLMPEVSQFSVAELITRILFNNDTLTELSHLTSLFIRRVARYYAFKGADEVLDHDVRLELHDRDGKHSTYFKRQRVRFLQDNVIAFQDQAWGDGEIFEDYKCSPGVAVDRYREAYRFRILISLRETKQYGDIEEFHIERKIKNGFVGDVQDFQTQIDHRTRKLTLSVIFPSDRHPRELWLLERNSTKAIALGMNEKTTLPDGRTQVNWHTDKVRLFEAYTLRWKW